MFTYRRIRFSIIILNSFIKEGVRGIVLGYIEDCAKRDFSFLFGMGGKLPVFKGPLGT